jgi:hypothetical protein
MAEFQQISTHEDAPPPPEGTKEHEQAMVQLAEEANAVEREDEQPSWLPEKFESPEDMAKAYHELEQKLSSESESVTDSDEGSPPPQTPLQPTIEETKKALSEQGLDYDKYQKEYVDTNTLSKESYAELKEKGMSSEMVDSWIEGQNAITEKLTDAAYSSVGGEKEYKDIVSWAAKSLPQIEQEAFNRALESANPNDGMFAIKSLNAQYKMANGSEPNLLQGSTGKSGSEAYTSLTQMSEAMRDPKYETDPAFREEVTRKLESSNLM